MKLVPSDTPYSPGRASLSGPEHELSRATFEIIQAFRKEVSEHDEDPGFDFDDALSAIMRSYGFGRTLAAHFMGDPNLPKDIEAISHSVVRNLGILDESTPPTTGIPGTQVTEDTPGEPPPPPAPTAPKSKAKEKKG